MNPSLLSGRNWKTSTIPVSPKVTSPDLGGNTVLSFSFDKDLLPRREAALRGVGYKVFSTTSEACVRFEIQMGQCGILLLCYTIPDAIGRDLAGLFARHCEGGVIAFVMHPLKRVESRYAQICLLDSDFPQKLHLMEGCRTSKSAAENIPVFECRDCCSGNDSF